VSYDDDPDDLHEGYIEEPDVVNHALEHYWDDVERAVVESRAREWLSQSEPCLHLLNIVSQGDHVHLRGCFKKRLFKKHDDDNELSAEQLFSIAADVASYLEQISNTVPHYPFMGLIHPEMLLERDPTPTLCLAFSAKSCPLEEDLGWAKDILIVCRALEVFFRPSPTTQRTFIFARAWPTRFESSITILRETQHLFSYFGVRLIVASSLAAARILNGQTSQRILPAGFRNI
jgi:hypothetical protein